LLPQIYIPILSFCGVAGFIIKERLPIERKRSAMYKSLIFGICDFGEPAAGWRKNNMANPRISLSCS
jgi:hypothetical protein